MGLTRAIAAIAAFVFCLPVLSTWHPAVPIALRAVSAGLLVASLYRPVWGLLVLAALLPLGMLISALSSAPFGTVEAMELLIAPVALASAVRVLASRAPRDDGRLLWPAVVMACLVAAALMVQLALQRDASMAFGPWLTDFWRHLTRTYFVDGPIYPPLHRAFLWIWGLALAVLAERLLRESSEDRLAVTRMLVFGGAAAGAFALFRVAEIALRSGNVWKAVWDVLATLRISPHTDPNAAGSFYVMLAVPVVFWAGYARTWWSIVALPPLLAALWLTRSRTALLVFIIGVAAAWMMSRRWSWRRFAAVGVAGAVILGILIGVGFGRTQAAEPAMRFRLDMALVSFELASRSPIFGLGLDEFQAASVPLITPEAIRRFPPAVNGENAHNNFLQILVELGAMGLAAFLWLLASPGLAYVRAMPDASLGVEARGLAAGLLAFVLTCVAGHPLLVAQAALPFFLTLGLFAASLPRPGHARSADRQRWLAAVAVALIVLALMFRLPSTI